MATSKQRVRIGMGGEAKEIEVTPATLVQDLPELLGLKIMKFKRFSIICGEQRFSSGFLQDAKESAALGNSEVQTYINNDIEEIFTTVISHMRMKIGIETFIDLEDDYNVALDLLRQMDPIPSDLSMRFVDTLRQLIPAVVRLDRAPPYTATSSWFELQIPLARVIGQGCENPGSESKLNTIMAIIDEHKRSSRRVMGFYVMLFEMALREPSLLAGDAYTRVLFSLSRSEYLAVSNGEELTVEPLECLRRLSDRLGSYDLYVTEGCVRYFEALMSTLPKLICVLDDKGIGRRVLQQCQQLGEWAKKSYVPSALLESILTGAEVVNAFVQHPGWNVFGRPCVNDLESEHPKDDAPEVDFEMFQNALLDADGDVVTCDILASKQGETLNTLSLSDADRDQHRPSKSAPGRLENESSSARSSWCRAALALPDVGASSEVTADAWEKAEEEVAKPVAMAEEDAKADAAAAAQVAAEGAKAEEDAKTEARAVNEAHR